MPLVACFSLVPFLYGSATRGAEEHATLSLLLPPPACLAHRDLQWPRRLVCTGDGDRCGGTGGSHRTACARCPRVDHHTGDGGTVAVAVVALDAAAQRRGAMIAVAVAVTGAAVDRRALEGGKGWRGRTGGGDPPPLPSLRPRGARGAHTPVVATVVTGRAETASSRYLLAGLFVPSVCASAGSVRAHRSGLDRDVASHDGRSTAAKGVAYDEDSLWTGVACVCVPNEEQRTWADSPGLVVVRTVGPTSCSTQRNCLRRSSVRYFCDKVRVSCRSVTPSLTSTSGWPARRLAPPTHFPACHRRAYFFYCSRCARSIAPRPHRSV